MESSNQSNPGAVERIRSKLDVLDFSIRQGRSTLAHVRTQLTDAIFDDLQKRSDAIRDEIVTL